MPVDSSDAICGTCSWIMTIIHEIGVNSAAGQRLRQATWAGGEASQSRKSAKLVGGLEVREARLCQRARILI